MNPKEFLLDILFPSRCLICATSLTCATKGQAACASCLDAITIHQTLFCIVCRARLADEKRICHKDTALRLAAVGNYDDAGLASLITQLKYEHRTLATEALSLLMSRYLANLNFDFSEYTIIPVPLYAKRERERGFNQSLLLAWHLAQHLKLQLLQGTLLKIRSTLAQAETKSLAERKSNLVGCFKVTEPADIAGKKILLVDDVCTSGATLTEAAETLKKAGAKNIIGFVMAKT